MSQATTLVLSELSSLSLDTEEFRGFVAHPTQTIIVFCSANVANCKLNRHSLLFLELTDDLLKVRITK